MPDTPPLETPMASPPALPPALVPLLLAAVIAGAGTVSTPRTVRAQWTDVTTPALAETTLIHDKKGVAFVDFDGDGDLDICSVGEGFDTGALFRNDGGSFTDVTPAPLLISGSGSGQTWGDLDNDGDLDVFVSYEEEPMRMLRNDGNGVFTNITAGVLAETAHGHSTSWADYDRDGLLDLYVAYFHQPSKLLHNVGGAFVDVTADSLGVVFGDGVAWGDYDNDGDPDIYLARFSFWPCVMMRNDGAQGFTNVTTPALAVTDNVHSCAAADYDNDGDLDLYLAVSLGPNHLLKNNWPAGFARATPPNLMLGAHSVSPCWGDFDNDGWLDLFVTGTRGANLEDGVNHLFHSNGNGTFTEITSTALRGTGANAGVAAGDYDGDGDLDLYVSSYVSRPNLLLRNDLANGNHWLQLDLEGTLSNRTAIGARVWLTAGGMTQMREVQGCTGFRSQSALTQHFGLGAATQVERIRIRWPSGIWMDTTLTVVDQRVKMVERMTGLGAVDDRHPAGPGVALAAPTPNPVGESTQLDFTLPVAASVRLAILDVQGRAVRVLEQGVLPAGAHRRTWNGRDDSGRRLAPGVYLAHVLAGSAAAVRRIVVVD